MRDLYLKLRILFGFFRAAFREWRTDVWPRELNEQYCCDGRECGCFGATVYEIYGPHTPVKERDDG